LRPGDCSGSSQGGVGDQASVRSAVDQESFGLPTPALRGS